MAREKKHRMTADEAFRRALEMGGFEAGCDGQFFAMVGYENTNGTIEGPMFITVERGVAVEVDRDGKFVNVYTAKLDRFFPWVTMKSTRGITTSS
jgi:hypothetical protein